MINIQNIWKRGLIILSFLLLIGHIHLIGQNPSAGELIGIHVVSKSNIASISDPIQGTIVYDSDDDRIYLFDGSDWLKLKVEKEVIKNLTDSYKLLEADNGKALTINSSSAVTLTIPSGLDVGFNVSVYQTGTGKITFQGSGTTLKNRLSRYKSAGKDAGVGILCTDTDIFHLTGDLKK